MTDYFAVMEVLRAPWLDGDELKERFHRLGAVRHPDAPGGSAAEFSALNEAWQTLRDPVLRLRHFLQLTEPELLNRTNQAPAELGDLFMEVAMLTHSGQRFAASREKAASPIARALVEPQRLSLLARVDAVQGRVRHELQECHAGIRCEAATGAELAGWLGRLTFLSNWERQLAELRMALAE